MKRLLLRIVANTIAIFIVSWLFPSIVLDNLWTGLLAGTVLTFLNILVRPVLLLVTLPINLITIGLFTLVINTWMVMLAAYLVAGVTIPGFLLAFVTALVVTLINMVLTQWFKNLR